MNPSLWAMPLSRLSLLVLVLIALTSAPAPGQDQRSGAAALESREILAGTVRHWPPHYGLDKDGRPIGFAVDVMKAVAEQAELELSFRVFEDFPQLLEAFRAGEIDVIPSMGISPERRAFAAFTSPLETFAISIFVRDDDAGTGELDDLVGRPVAVVRANLGAVLMKQRPDIETVAYNDERTALFELLSGHVDAIIYPKPVMLTLAQEAGVADRIKVAGDPLREIKRGIAVQKSNPALLAALDAAVHVFNHSTGYQEIYRRWHGLQPDFWTVKRMLSVAVPLLVLVLAAMVWWRYHSIVVLNQKLGDSVAELTEAQAAIQENEARFRDFAASASDWLWELDEQFRFTMHTADPDETGYKIETVLGKARWDLPALNPEADIWRQHRADLEAHRSFSGFEFDFIDGAGRKRVLRISGRPVFESDGRFKGYRGSTTDVTQNRQAMEALRESEKLLRDTIESMPFVVYLWDRDERMLICNSTQHEWFPEHRHAMRVGAKYEEHLRINVERGLINGTIDDPEAFIRERLDVFRRPHLYPNDRIQVKDRWLQVINKKLPDGSTLGVRLDITEAKAAEDSLRQSQKMEAVGQLTGGVAHDFNNLLGVILGNAELLSDQLGGSSPQAAAVIRAAERGADLTQRLLAFSRKQALQPRALDLNAVVEGIVELLRRTLGEDVEIETIGGQDLRICEVDPSQLESALLNMAVNSRDAMPEGGKLTVETANVDLDEAYAATSSEVIPGPYVALIVSDTGGGIPAETLPHVFEPFFTTKDVGRGSGLGLSMVYGFAKQSGGHVAIYSEVGHGTTVKLYLPMSDGAAAEASNLADGEIPRAGGEVVLVVEDDPDLLALTVSHLSALGYRTLEASDGEAAIAVLNGKPRVDLLLTDVVLPGRFGGASLAERARLSHAGLKVLFMSGYTENAIVHQGKLDEGVMLLHKPFRRAEVARAVREALDRPAS